jgi:hypothetical protein
MDTDATAPRYHIVDIAPLNRVCTALKAETTPRLRLSPFKLDLLVGFEFKCSFGISAAV